MYQDGIPGYKIAERIGVSKSTVYRLIQELKLQKPEHLTAWNDEKRWVIWWIREHTDLSYSEIASLDPKWTKGAVDGQFQRNGLLYHPPSTPKPENLEQKCITLLEREGFHDRIRNREP